MAKKEKQPEFLLSPINTKLTNYRTYRMSGSERMLTTLGAVVAGGAAGVIFYGGRFCDENGAMTLATLLSNLIIFLVAGVATSVVFLPLRTGQLRRKRIRELVLQFRSFLEALAVSLASGMNVRDSLKGASDSLKNEYGEEADMVLEVREMLNCLENNIPLEQALNSLGERSDQDDIKKFATAFTVSYKYGANLKDVVRRTNKILGDKIETEMEIETMMASNRMQFNAMLVVPLGIVLMMRVMSTSFSAGFSSVPGTIAMTVALGIFFGAYRMGTKIMETDR